MATIKTHPGITRYHRRFDTASHTTDDRAGMLADYESGKLILLDNCDFNIDYDLFDTIHIEKHPDKLVQYLEAKLSMGDYLDILWGPEPVFRELRKPLVWLRDRSRYKEAAYVTLKEHLRTTAFADLDLRIRLARQILDFRGRILRFYKDLFPEYRFYHCSINWRLTESRRESMHVDAYRTDRDFHQVKLFINLDSAPRIWNTGEPMKTLISRHYDGLDLKQHIGLEYHRFLEKCDAVLFDPENGPRDGQVFHTMFFDRGDVWIAETRHIPHQVFFGRKMVSVQFYIAPSRRIAPELSMKHFVDSLRGYPVSYGGLLSRLMSVSH